MPSEMHAIASAPAAPSASIAFFRALLASRKAMLGLVIFALIVAGAIFSPLLAPYAPDTQSLSGRLLPPFSHATNGAYHILGTDQLGRDMLSRLIYGARISLLVGVCASLLAGSVGVLLGLLAGYRGGWTDDVVMRCSDVQLALPYILIAITVVAVVGRSLFDIVLILSGAQWVTYARVVRAGVLSVKEQDYVLAARALGFGTSRILARYILPNVFAPVIVIATFAVAQAILAETALSFLGLSVPPSVPSWGGMLAEGRTYLAIAWWLTTIPGMAICLTVIGINLLGDWLRDYLDPRLRL
jgi:peptide/nickel transport system permease protein